MTRFDFIIMMTRQFDDLIDGMKACTFDKIERIVSDYNDALADEDEDAADYYVYNIKEYISSADSNKKKWKQAFADMSKPGSNDKEMVVLYAEYKAFLEEKLMHANEEVDETIDFAVLILKTFLKTFLKEA